MKYLLLFLPSIFVVILYIVLETTEVDHRIDYYNEGRSAARYGLPDTCCPYHSGGKGAYENWKQGWIDQMIENKLSKE